MLELFAKAIFDGATAGLVPHLSPSRWTILPVQPNVSAFGLVFGRRLSGAVGVVAMLLLQEDGSFLPLLVPVDGEIPVFEEDEVRARFVHARRPGYAPRGHVFEPSPVFPGLCRLCATLPLAHEQEALRVAIERTLGTLEVSMSFVRGTTKIEMIEVRQPPTDQPILNPMPGSLPEFAPPNAGVSSLNMPPSMSRPKVPYRPLSDKERIMLERVLKIELPPVRATVVP